MHNMACNDKVRSKTGIAGLVQQSRQGRMHAAQAAEDTHDAAAQGGGDKGGVGGTGHSKSYSGVGLGILKQDHKLVVVEVLRDGPAYHARLTCICVCV